MKFNTRTVETLQSHFILTMSHWSSGLPVCFSSQGPRFKTPVGRLMWNRDSPVSLVSLHWWPRCDWSSLWPRLRLASSRTITRPSCRQCDNPTWSHTAFLSWFHARCRSPFRLHNRQSRLLGGSPVDSLQSHFILTMSHWSSGLPVCFLSQESRFKSPGGYLCETGILLLVLSCYSTFLYIGLPSLLWGVGGDCQSCRCPSPTPTPQPSSSQRPSQPRSPSRWVASCFVDPDPNSIQR
jgi:hypothetical protein